MAQDFLNEREFELVNIVGAQLAKSQRELSRHMNLSLGMTNMLLKRLVSKGYIRIQQLNSRKVQYLLTPKGFSEKMNKSLKYTLKTINSISLIKINLSKVLSHLYRQGHHEFIVLGTSDLALLIDLAVKESGLVNCRLHYVSEWNNQISKGVLLVCKEDVHIDSSDSLFVVNVLHELSKDDHLVSQTEGRG